jgi:hypothetical protein
MDPEPLPAASRWTASSNYAFGRLRRAAETAATHDDPDVRRRAGEKALAWEAVISGMASGAIEVGSRTPVADTPAWVTLEVVHGGFATGRYVAESPVRDDERDLLAQLPDDGDPAASPRLRLNSWFLSDDGLAVLSEALRTGDYQVEVPEHGALLVVAWLVQHGHGPAALDLVAELYPLFDRLRFYPVLRDRSPASGALVRLRTVRQVTAQLQAVTVPDQVAAMNETIEVWHPLYDRLVELWLETVEDGAAPGAGPVGWPCATFPDGWDERRRRWLDDYRRAAAEHTRSRAHRRPRGTFAVLREALERFEPAQPSLTRREIGHLRARLQGSVTRWGAPGSAGRVRLREAQRDGASRPTHRQLARVLAERLDRLAPDGGIAELAPLLEPIPLRAGPVAVPAGLARKVERALEAPIEELVARGIIPSSEVLAGVLPQISAHVASGAFAEPALRELYARVYAAFRRRRSLLLLDLQHQVQLGELPWVRAVDPLRTPTPDTRDRARDTLSHATLLALSAFPQTILPNPLVREMSALAAQAELDLPFVEEVAADIFMGTFTRKWREAAVLASTIMEGTLYARYYSLPTPADWPARAADGAGLIDRVRRRGSRPHVAADFASLCESRAREAATGDGSFVARNGTVLEQSQILTTHNLAPLVASLGLDAKVRARAGELATRTFDWIVRQQTMRLYSWRSQLQMVKNTAYAWRQAIFLLSYVPPAEQAAAVQALRMTVASQPGEWQQRFTPAVQGLQAVVDGAAFDARGRVRPERRGADQGDGRRFLGWSVGPHWMLAQRPVPRRR